MHLNLEVSSSLEESEDCERNNSWVMIFHRYKGDGSESSQLDEENKRIV